MLYSSAQSDLETSLQSDTHQADGSPLMLTWSSTACFTFVPFGTARFLWPCSASEGCAGAQCRVDSVYTALQATAMWELKGSETCAVVTKVHQGKALALAVCRQLLFSGAQHYNVLTRNHS